MALHSLYCADVPLRNCSLTHSFISNQIMMKFIGKVLKVNMYRFVESDFD